MGGLIEHAAVRCDGCGRHVVVKVWKGQGLAKVRKKLAAKGWRFPPFKDLCPVCARRDHWSRPVADPTCGVCGAAMRRTSRLAVGIWCRDGVVLAKRFLDYDQARRAAEREC